MNAKVHFTTKIAEFEPEDWTVGERSDDVIQKTILFNKYFSR
tara:strand:- start:289 stop:414 length:126 start_codon:yes stop_codon:yes gene_type:complete